MSACSRRLRHEVAAPRFRRISTNKLQRVVVQLFKLDTKKRETIEIIECIQMKMANQPQQLVSCYQIQDCQYSDLLLSVLKKMLSNFKFKCFAPCNLIYNRKRPFVVVWDNRWYQWWFCANFVMMLQYPANSLSRHGLGLIILMKEAKQMLNTEYWALFNIISVSVDLHWTLSQHTNIHVRYVSVVWPCHQDRPELQGLVCQLRSYSMSLIIPMKKEAK
jgi:hypothetical protein